MSELREAAQRCARQQQTIWLSCNKVSPPKGGMAWRPYISCKWQPDPRGCMIAVFGGPVEPPMDAYHRARFKLTATHSTSDRAFSRPGDTGMVNSEGLAWGFDDFFGLGPLTDGWDDAACAAKGLSSEGQLNITLTVTGVGHIK